MSHKSIRDRFRDGIVRLTNGPSRVLHHELPRSVSARSATGDSQPLPPAESALRRSPVDAPSVPIQPRPCKDSRNPILTGADVSDFGAADYVADPFLCPTADRWHLFFEVFNRRRTPTAAIGHSSSADGQKWTSGEIVLERGAHLSFPYVFEYDGEHYMLPDQQRDSDDARVTLFRATDFPKAWEPVSTIVSPPRRTSDHVVFKWNDRWWCFVGHEPSGSLYCYHNDSLEADHWTPHAGNPVVSDRIEAARPGGRPLVTSEGILLFYQDCENGYGQCVRAGFVSELSPDSFVESLVQEDPVLAGNGLVGWSSGRMHHIDPWWTGDGFVCAADGDIALGRGTWASAQWSVGLYRF